MAEQACSCRACARRCREIGRAAADQRDTEHAGAQSGRPASGSEFARYLHTLPKKAQAAILDDLEELFHVAVRENRP